MAYVKSGVLTTMRAPIRRNHTSIADLGVLFVHGLGASCSQFRRLRRALSADVRWFDAFEYSSGEALEQTASALGAHIAATADRCDRLVVVGHSLGGVLLRMVLQQDAPPDNVVGFVSICAPLHGTTVGRFAPTKRLRALVPGSPLFTGLAGTADRLERYAGAVLTVGSSRDHFVIPPSSAFLDGHDALEVDEAGHVSCLFDTDVHDAVGKLVRRLC